MCSSPLYTGRFKLPSQIETHVLAGAHGWNIDIDADVRVCQQVRLLREIGTVAGWRVCICTLLGPEGPDLLRFGGGRTNLRASFA